MDRYLDTADGRLAAAGWACRLRTRGTSTIVSLKGPAQHRPGSSLHLRPELDGPAQASDDADRWPPSPARDFVLEQSGGSPLIERFTLRQRRVERQVRLDQRVAGTLSLDTAQVTAGGREYGVLYVVELELDHALITGGLDPEPLQLALAAEVGLAPEPKSKFARALERLAAATPNSRRTGM